MDPVTTPDVNIDPVPSADPGVIAGSPPADGVTPPASPAEPTPPPVKPHEDTVPYERLKEEIDKNKELQARIDVAAGPPEPLESPAAPETPPAQAPIDWSTLGFASPPTQPQGAPQQVQQAPIATPEEIEQRIRDDMYNKPYATFAPIIIELAKQVVLDQKRQEAQVRGMPGFQQVESSYYNIPDDVVQQAQGNPEIIRYLIARNSNAAMGLPAPTLPALPTAQGVQPTQPISDPNNPPKTMEELKQQYIAEGERLALLKLKNQQGLTSEGAGYIPSPTGDQPELDDGQKSFMRRLGIKEERFTNVANRLQSETGGK